jgi:hypothetical protein
MRKYSVNQQFIETILASVKVGEVAIPEIQCRFVWDSSKEFVGMRRRMLAEKIRGYYFTL